MYMRKYIVVIILIIIVGVIFFYLRPTKSSQPQSTWQTYTSAEYGVSFSYPADWQVSVDPKFPVINVYKKSETAKPPFTIHTQATAVSIFPQGLGTEGPQSATAPTKVSFKEPMRTANDFILQDGTPWATIGYFAATTTTWSEFAFVWANVEVKNEQTVCEKDGQELPAESCTDGIEFIGTSFVKKGTIDPADRQIEVKILESISLTNKPTVTVKTYESNAAGLTINYPTNYNEVTPKQDYFMGTNWQYGNEQKGLPGVLLTEIRRQDSNDVLTARIRIGYSTSTNAVKTCEAVPEGLHGNTVMINGVQFTMFEQSDAGMSHSLTSESFRTVYNSACYAIDELITGTNPEVYNPPKTVPFERDTARREMMSAIYSLRFLK